MGIELRKVSKQVGAETYIYETNLSLEKGGFNVLLGTALSGKTTLMRLMAGLEPPTTGELWFDGENVTGVPVQKRSVAMVYQQFINYPNFSVFDNIASPLRVARIPAGELRQRVERIAELLRLTPMLQRFPNELSGGQQQRTALARALVKNAPLVLLDEPLANLDYKLREELRDELPKLFKGTGATVVYATSEPLEALMLAGNTATLHEGRVTQYGPTAKIYRTPNTLLSAQVFSDPPINTANVNKKGDTFHLTDAVSWRVPNGFAGLGDGSYTMGIRPHHLTLGTAPKNAVKVCATVLVAEISGSESVVHVNVEGNNWVSESHGVHPYKVGDSVELFISVERCLYFGSDGQLLTG
ncbi:MAG: ABC transporter ATP-binding protein [Gammaproteobacteria bacterium]|jgi:glycerol transport system ATP-binding protein|nr:ABC transporter ATP-binding protein [Gammaproteobacteria bacterium]